VLTEGENVEAEPVGEFGVADDFRYPLPATRCSAVNGARVAGSILQVGEGQDAKFHTSPRVRMVVVAGGQGSCVDGAGSDSASAGPALSGIPGQPMVTTILPRVPWAKASKASCAWANG